MLPPPCPAFVAGAVPALAAGAGSAFASVAVPASGAGAGAFVSAGAVPGLVPEGSDGAFAAPSGSSLLEGRAEAVALLGLEDALDLPDIFSKMCQFVLWEIYKVPPLFLEVFNLPLKDKQKEKKKIFAKAPYL